MLPPLAQWEAPPRQAMPQPGSPGTPPNRHETAGHSLSSLQPCSDQPGRLLCSALPESLFADNKYFHTLGACAASSVSISEPSIWWRADPTALLATTRQAGGLGDHPPPGGLPCLFYDGSCSLLAYAVSCAAAAGRLHWSRSYHQGVPFSPSKLKNRPNWVAKWRNDRDGRSRSK